MGFVVDLIKGAMIHNHSWKDILPFGDFTGDFRIVGNLTVRGSLIQEQTIAVEDVLIADNIITLNNGEIGSGVTGVYSGIEVDRGLSPNSYLRYNETDDLWHYGFIGGTDYIIRDKTYYDSLYSSISHTHTQTIIRNMNFNANGNLIPTSTAGTYQALVDGTLSWAINSVNNLARTCSFDVLKNGISMVGTGTKPYLNNETNRTGNCSNWSSASVAVGDMITISCYANTDATNINVNLIVSKTI